MVQLKIVTLATLSLFIVSSANCQISLPSNLLGNNLYTFSNSQVGIVFNAQNSTRHNSIAYNDLKMDGYQVISLYQPDMGQDRVYYIDKEGNGVNQFFAPTGVSNISSFDRVPYDSFNPTGAADVGQALAYGMINLLFQKKKIRFTPN